jgi:hypothetical protein
MGQLFEWRRARSESLDDILGSVVCRYDGAGGAKRERYGGIGFVEAKRYRCNLEFFWILVSKGSS